VLRLDYAKRCADYLMVHGMPKPSDRDRRCDAAFGDVWSAQEIALVRPAILWLALRGHVPDTGLKVEDIFAGNALAIAFEGAQTIAKEPTVTSMKVGRAADVRPAAITWVSTNGSVMPIPSDASAGLSHVRQEIGVVVRASMLKVAGSDEDVP
jgi:hypothetical protein